MADLDRDLQNGDVLPLLYKADRDRELRSTVDDMEAVSLAEMLLVGSGGLFSMAIVALGFWKLIELVA
ncbi:hypothetical protein [Parvibaculum sp.]|jgi:hypothetical protein|uniref:hypothetical protein n=1 Tax=Parvibaculum sp. TaxID=2024848 RepID=UPI000C438A7E|nr:hypothetical protein [Parvibaculum sp.]HAC59241.1 hypothetical protein [Rhodobiaceae bacterium]MAU61956.1 hypothetical protein [Parvibaculum sp.]MBO6666848.1 hypothetical protein [Parvibaculum sp.]MBO6691634.1 hypothetical protein [Parvibaculum sp.]MBO6713469.1 hypothetical protein [Parvibaculum sp.]|tara:strand:+ start:2254 stop:2457 length:204 start_codon:yes stop_codon:yes gene_type:complete